MRTWTEPPESVIEAAFDRNDENAWAELYRHLWGPLYAQGYLLERNHHDAEDLAEDTFVRAYRARKAFKLGKPLRPWLLTIEYRLFLDRVRKLKRCDGAMTNVRDRESRAPERDDARLVELRLQVQALPPEERAVFLLVDVEELPVSAAAEILGVSPNTVRRRLAAAEQHLRTHGSEGD